MNAQRRKELDAEWKRLDGQKMYPGLLMYAGGALFVGNLFGIEEPTNNTLGTITFMAFVAGGVWLWHLRKEQNRIIRSIVEDDLDQKRLQDAAKSEKTS